MSEAVHLQLQDVSVRHGRVLALESISFEVNSGESFAILGANGAGKTTAVEALAGLNSLERGRIQYRGKDISRLDATRVSRLGISLVSQERDLFGNLTVEENLRLGATSRRRGARNLKDGLTYVYELFPRLLERRSQTVKTLSGGEQQMVAIARALVSEPELLILDEPTAGLAPVIVDELTHTLRMLAGTGTTLILAEQNLALASAITDRYIVLRDRLLVYQGNFRADHVENTEKIKDLYI